MLKIHASTRKGPLIFAEIIALVVEAYTPSFVNLKFSIGRFSLYTNTSLKKGRHILSSFRQFGLTFRLCQPFFLLELLIRGHSTTTWTNFDPILIPSPLEWTSVDIPHTPPVHVDKRGKKSPPLKYSITLRD